MKLILDKRVFGKSLKGKIEGYQFEVGVLADRPHYAPISQGAFESPQTRQYAGGPVRKQSRTTDELTRGEILVENMKRLNTDLLREPFKNKNSDILKFTKGFLRLVTDRGMSLKRVENLLQAIVRNPILRQEYGKNNSRTADSKGFDRHLFDTGQMFKAIRARARRVRK